MPFQSCSVKKARLIISNLLKPRNFQLYTELILMKYRTWYGCCHPFSDAGRYVGRGKQEKACEYNVTVRQHPPQDCYSTGEVFQRQAFVSSVHKRSNFFGSSSWQLLDCIITTGSHKMQQILVNRLFFFFFCTNIKVKLKFPYSVRKKNIIPV